VVNPSKSWAATLLARKPARVVAVALANKTARIAWALLARNQSYTAPAAYPPRRSAGGAIGPIRKRKQRDCKGGERR
jgi:hypothetical protein